MLSIPNPLIVVEALNQVNQWWLHMPIDNLPFSEEFIDFIHIANTRKLFDFHPEVGMAVNNEIQQLRQKLHESRQLTPALIFDLQVTQQIANALAHSAFDKDRPETQQLFARFREFSSSAITNFQQTLQDLQANKKQAGAATPLLDNIFNEAAQKAQGLNDAIRDLSLEHRDFSRHLQELTAKLETAQLTKLPKRLDTAEHCRELQILANGYLDYSRELLPQHDPNEKLQQAIEAGGGYVVKLTAELDKAKASGDPDIQKLLSETLEKTKKQITELEQEKQRRNQLEKIAGFKNGCALIQIVSDTILRHGWFGEAAAPYLRGAAQLATAGSAIADFASNLINCSAICAASGPLAPVVGAALALQTAISAISSLFGGKPRPTDREVLLEAMQALSSQITQVETAVRQGFQTTFLALRALDDNAQVRFESIQRNLAVLHTEITQTNINVAAALASLTSIIDTLRAANIKFVELYEQNYQIFIQETEGLLRNPAVILDAIQIEGRIRRFQERICREAMSVTLAGEDSVSSDDKETIIRLCHEKSPYQNINLLRFFASTMVDTVRTRLPNPVVWAEATGRLTDFLMRTPTADLSLYQDALHEMLTGGMQIQQFILQLKTLPFFLARCLGNYELSIRNAKMALKESILEYGKFKDFAEMKNLVISRLPLHRQLEQLKSDLEQRKEELHKITVALDEQRKMQEEDAKKIAQLERIAKEQSDDTLTRRMAAMATSTNSWSLLFNAVGAAGAAANYVLDQHESRVHSKTADAAKPSPVALIERRIARLDADRLKFEDEIEQLTRSISGFQPLAKNLEEDIYYAYIRKFIVTNQEEFQRFLHEVNTRVTTPTSRLALSLREVELNYSLLVSLVSLLFNDDRELIEKMRTLASSNTLTSQLQNLLNTPEFASKICAARLFEFFTQPRLTEAVDEFRRELITKIQQCGEAQTRGETVTSYPPVDMGIKQLEMMLALQTAAKAASSKRTAISEESGAPSLKRARSQSPTEAQKKLDAQLLAAAKNHDLSAAQDALTQGATLNIVDQDSSHHGWTALHWIAAHGNVAMLHALAPTLQKSQINTRTAPPSRLYFGFGRDRETALDIAVRLQQQEMIILLQTMGAKSATELDHSVPPMESFHQSP